MVHLKRAEQGEPYDRSHQAMFVAASCGMRTGKVLAHDTHDIINIA